MVGRLREPGAPVAGDWQACSVPPGAVEGPNGLDAVRANWLSSAAPSTAAATLRAAGAWSLDAPPRRFDAEDWWWRTRFHGTGPQRLAFDGLASLADVWLNGVHLLASESMFLCHERRVELAGDNDLAIRFRALDPLLAVRRPRPAWRVPMVEHQQLRWFRTTLLGRTPGWSPPAAPVGPWRPIRRLDDATPSVDDLSLSARVDGHFGLVDVQCKAPGRRVDLVVHRRGVVHRCRIEGSARLEVPDVSLWWPHTHGEPALYGAHLVVDGRELDIGAIGFRTLEVDQSHDGFSVNVNGAPIFCRGACWTPLDPVSLSSSETELARALEQVRAAGMNMLRLSGTMVYERPAFYDLCDELGVLVWQDLMFANMDYPGDDPGFVALASAEARQWCEGMQGRPSLAVVCGNSEGEQQAAMFGASRERWSPRLFHETLPAIVREVCPGVTYWPSSAHGGAFPHQASAGTTSYYGVGAYLRPLEDARRSELRFATECLAFANLPAKADGSALDPSKARTPRDLGASWDFDDVRDHYLKMLFDQDPAALRRCDAERYVELGRVVTGEVMAAAFGEWRRQRSTCGGALIWWLRDLWPSSGWGVVGADGAPKPPYWYLRRALAPIAVHLSDEGGNGLALHAWNDGPRPLDATLELTTYRSGEFVATRAERRLEVGPRAGIELPVVALFDGFSDPNWAYRFGPPSCDLVVAALRGADGRALASAFHFPLGLPSKREVDVGLAAVARALEGGDAELVVHTRRFAQSLSLEIEGFVPDDDFFHLPPGGERTLRLQRVTTDTRPPRGKIRALNAESSARIEIVG